MKLQLFTFLIFVVLTSGCSSQNKQDMPALTADASATVSGDQADQPKPKRRHRHRPTPNGPVSLDIIEDNGEIHLLVGRHQDGVKSLWYQVSKDQGKSWSTATRVHRQPHIEANMVRGNDARLAVQGDNIVVVWPSRVEGKPHNAGPMEAVRSTDAGKTWQITSIPSDWTEGSNAFFAMDSNDEFINIVWLDSRFGKSGVPGSQGLRFAQSGDGGQSWSANKTLDDVTCACCWNASAFSKSDEYFVLYRDKEPSDMAIGRVDQNSNWQRLNTVGDFKWDFPGCPHIGGGIAFQDQDQFLHATVGTGLVDRPGVFYLRSLDQGENWQVPVQLGDESALHSDVAAANNGKVMAVWDMRTEDGLSVYYVESGDHGASWSAPKRLSADGVRASHPRVVASGNSFVTVWTESTDGETQSLQIKQL